MHNAISDLGLWDQVRGGYARKRFRHVAGMDYPDTKYMDRIQGHPLVNACGHSGFTLGACMRTMEFIAQEGWGKYCEECTATSTSDD